MFKRIKELFALDESIANKQKEIQVLEQQLEALRKDQNDTKSYLDRILEQEKRMWQKERDTMIQSATDEANRIREEQRVAEETIKELQKNIAEAEEKNKQIQAEVKKNNKKTKTYVTEMEGIRNFINRFGLFVMDANFEKIQSEIEKIYHEDTNFYPVVTLDLHHMHSKKLRTEMNEVQKDIKKLLEEYSGRYGTKANRTIYELMVIGLQAELQNILFTLQISKLSDATDQAKTVINKYLAIATDGNASILKTITKFLMSLEPLFIKAIEVEYQYHVQKEREKEEQRRIKEIMRQEAEERKKLEEERKKLEKEEEKFIAEMNKAKEQLEKETDDSKVASLQAKIAELESKVEKLEEDKAEIIKRANGKAGYVYVISNLGSFGEKMFKIGMTRRMIPTERIDELGDASVPFPFDIHALVFSDHAVDLETQLHQRLSEKRVNKINLRKEFFYSDIEQLQKIVEEIDPTLEFVTTMVAQQYRQSISGVVDVQDIMTTTDGIDEE